MNLGGIFELLLGQLINIPLINPLSYVYVALNLVSYVFATFLSILFAPTEETT